MTYFTPFGVRILLNSLKKEEDYPYNIICKLSILKLKKKRKAQNQINQINPNNYLDK